MGCRPRSVGLQLVCPTHGLWRKNWEGSICLYMPQPSHSPHLLPCTPTLRGSLLSLEHSPPPPQAFTAPLAPTAPYHFPSLHTKAQLPSLHGLRPQGPVFGRQHSKLVGSKALLTTGKALMILPTAKVLISFSPKPELKWAPTILKPRKVGLKLTRTQEGNDECWGQGWRAQAEGSSWAGWSLKGRACFPQNSLPRQIPDHLSPSSLLLYQGCCYSQAPLWSPSWKCLVAFTL
ncbi:hypothetical protein HJG60_019737 [Phyllostomus discolor]|uniref:Uncharacterized protein n=1 Tax=Phyllostomus discolor TaxID=89673 RepID=A0A833ZR02_9CHIR|nr:hypothetical protein HJG60_019737 [Phyllostomus discolor]